VTGAATSTTLPARATAAPSAASSSAPNADGWSKIKSTPMASGLPAATASISRAWVARGNGHGWFTSTNEASSMLMMTMGAVGARVPRYSKKRSSRASS